MVIKTNILIDKEEYQQAILEHLKNNNNYQIRSYDYNYDTNRAMDTSLLLKFLYNTQKDKIEQLVEIYKNDTDEVIINYINNTIINNGLLNVLKHGVYFGSGIKLDLMYKKPVNNLNKEFNLKYSENILSVMKDVYNKENEPLDFVIFLNGLTIFSVIVKGNTNGETYLDSIKDYKKLDYNTRLLKFKSGCLANFAIGLKEVHVCTHLNGLYSEFLPFNKGRGSGINTGKGNPDNLNGINVSYMRNDILKKNSILYLIDNFMCIQQNTDNDGELEETLFFPRYHQLNVIRKIGKDIKENETHKNYLIQHFTGAGKTHTISWLTHRLSQLYNEENKIIFNKILIVTNGINITKKLINSLEATEHGIDEIEVINEKKKIQDLTNALEDNKRIIITTMQKFKFIMDNKILDQFKDKNFAVIINETPTISKKSHLIHSNNEICLNDLIKKEEEHFKKLPNVSMITFTPAPKNSTLKIFGNSNNGKQEPFDVYPMKQAIGEGFILDVLQNYITYESFYNLNKNVKNNPKLKSNFAKNKITKYEELNNTYQKVEIIVEHFKANMMNQLEGKGKAIIITSSPKSAIKFKLKFDKYVKKQKYKNLKALIAFPRDINYKGIIYNESTMNNIKKSIPEEFNKNKYQFLIVSDKYQTELNQPKLVAMYIDKDLSGFSAIQTLSLLNKTYYPYDKKTFILDFKNTYPIIENAVAPFYGKTSINKVIDPTEIYEINNNLKNYNFLDNEDIKKYNNLIEQYDPSKEDIIKIQKLFDKSLKKIHEYDEKTQINIKNEIKSFIDTYLLITLSTGLIDKKLLKRYNFLIKLVNMIIVEVGPIDLDFINNIMSTDFKQTNMRNLSNPKNGLNTPISKFNQTQKNRLSEIISNINKINNKNFNVEKSIDHLENVHERIIHDEKLKYSAKNDNIEDFKHTYSDSINSAFLEEYYEDKEFFEYILQNEDEREKIIEASYEDTYNILR